MRWSRWLSLLSVLALWFAAHAQQEDSTGHGPERPRRINLERFHRDEVHISGEGEEIPAVDLRELARPRHWIGDDSAFAQRDLVDSTWHHLFQTEDSVVPGAAVHWVRCRVVPTPELKDVPLVLSLGTYGEAEVYHNGKLVLHTSAMPDGGGSSWLPATDSMPLVSVPFRFACDGQPEVLAVRIQGAAGVPLERTGLELILREAGSSYATQRLTMHHGVFVGVNLIILILSVILWFQDRRDTNWLLLGLLSLIEAFNSFVDVAGDAGLLGYSTGISSTLEALSFLFWPWSFYLLILVLGRLRGDLSPKSVRRYTWAVCFVTLVLAIIQFGVLMGNDWLIGFFELDDTDHGQSTMDDPSPALIVLIVVGILLAIPFGLVLTWFTVDVMRLAMRLLRTKGYERWVGGGALASSLATGVFAFLSNFEGPAADWFAKAGNYCAHVAVPVAVAIYLAIRSAHHSKAVARQRDDLDREVHERTAELRAEKKRSDDLLLNILPAEVAEELKQTGAAEARHFDQATVMFTDFKGFTSMSEQVTPAELIAELNTCFKAFDDIIARRGIEKIKTIGDSYMCAGGLPDPSSSYPAGVVLAALEMQAFMQDRKVQREAEDKAAFVMRVGIHTGPVVAGIVGVKKFQYDIWGDTVNTASRMESSGEVGQVNISEATYALVREAMEVVDGREVPAFTFTPRGKVQAKGKGEMEMFFVRRSHESA